MTRNEAIQFAKNFNRTNKDTNALAAALAEAGYRTPKGEPLKPSSAYQLIFSGRYKRSRKAKAHTQNFTPVHTNTTSGVALADRVKLVKDVLTNKGFDNATRVNMALLLLNAK